MATEHTPDKGLAIASGTGAFVPSASSPVPGLDPAGLQSPIAWRCFHCDEVFTDEHAARQHFGSDEGSESACRLKAGAEGSILRALREAEKQAADAWFLLHEECSDFAKAYHTMLARHGQALMAAEELGYERGLADGRARNSHYQLVAALEALLPTNVGFDNPVWADSTVLPVDITLGELRRARAALKLAGGQQ